MHLSELHGPIYCTRSFISSVSISEESTLRNLSQLPFKLPYAISLNYQVNPPIANHCLLSLSATKATTLPLKQPTSFYSEVTLVMNDFV